MSLIEKFKSIFESEENEQTFTDYKLEDGTIVRADALEVGSKIEVIAEDGEVSLLAEGTYLLEDGTSITVDAEGVIAEVIAPAEEEVVEEVVEEEMEEAVVEETVEEEVKEDVVEDVVDETPEFDVTRVTELEEAVLLIMDKLKEMEGLKKENEKLEVAMSAIKEENEALKNTVPSKTAVKFKKIDPLNVKNVGVIKKGRFAEFIASQRNK